MKNKISGILEDVKAFTAENLEQLEEFRIKYLSKKGVVPALFADFKNVAPEERKEMGQLMNGLKNAVQEKIVSLKESLEKTSEDVDKPDLTLPAESTLGSRHPLSIVRTDLICDLLPIIGFTDDVAFLTYVISSASEYITPEIKEKAKEKMGNWINANVEDAEIFEEEVA